MSATTAVQVLGKLNSHPIGALHRTVSGAHAECAYGRKRHLICDHRGLILMVVGHGRRRH
ncbi:hypothetical protein ACWCQZ_40215 [Streptomyces sp. NPDC002285]